MTSDSKRSLRSKLGSAFILQAAAISCATVLGVYAAGMVLKDGLIKRALTDETSHFISRLDEQADAAPPDVYNMRGYHQRKDDPYADEAIPDHLLALPDGFHELGGPHGQKLVYVSNSRHGRLYMVFDQEHVNQLAVFYGIVPLTLVLLVIYIATWLTYRFSKRAVSPVIWLANEVRKLDPRNPDTSSIDPQQMPVDVDGDVLILAEALHNFALRNREFVERERTFTRDASHELRSPLTVIKFAAEVLQDELEMDDYYSRLVGRVCKATRDMESLIEAFLILARQADTGLPEERFVVNQIVREELEAAELLLKDKSVQMRFVEEAMFCLKAAPKVVAIMISNLIRNACAYTDQGEIVVSIGINTIQVRDTGIGISEKEMEAVFLPFFRAKGAPRGGHGVGLTIVKRLSDRFGWPVDIQSKLGVGTTVTVHFPNAEAWCRDSETL